MDRRLVSTAVTVEGRSKSSVARDYGLTRVWVQTMVKRFVAEGEAAFEPKSRRPHGNPRGSARRSKSRSSGSASSPRKTVWTVARKHRAHQALKKWLRAQPPATTLAMRSTAEPPPRRMRLDPRPFPPGPIIPAHHRVPHDRIDRWGGVMLSHNSRLHHIGLGARLGGTPVTLLIDNLRIRVIHRHTGELNRTGVSGDSNPWEGWGHVSRCVTKVSAGAEGAGGPDVHRGPE